MVFGFLNNTKRCSFFISIHLCRTSKTPNLPEREWRTWLGRLTDFLWSLTNALFQCSCITASNVKHRAGSPKSALSLSLHSQHHCTCPTEYRHISSPPLFCVLLPGMMKYILQHLGTLKKPTSQTKKTYPYASFEKAFKKALAKLKMDFEIIQHSQYWKVRCYFCLWV